MTLNISERRLQEEYRMLAEATMPRPRTEAEYNDAHASATLAYNRVKNRYTDVLPVEATRIKLETLPNEPGSDYINANHVVDPLSTQKPQTYICAQAPLQNTLNDFWRMVWEQNVCTIVVLMKLSENGKVKGNRYWPTRNKPVSVFNDIRVTLLKGKHFPHSNNDHKSQSDQTIIRVFELKRGEERRNIVQLHFKGWPDFGVPEATEPIRNLVRIMWFYRERSHAAGVCGPVLIHCSAGIGRTGTYLAIVFALNAIKQMKEVSGDSESGSTTNYIDRVRSELIGASESASLCSEEEAITFDSRQSSPSSHHSSPASTPVQSPALPSHTPKSSYAVISSSEAGGSGSFGPNSYSPSSSSVSSSSLNNHGSSQKTSPSLNLSNLTDQTSSKKIEDDSELEFCTQVSSSVCERLSSSPPPDSPFKRARSDSNASADSVVYEYSLRDEDDTSDESETSSTSETTTSSDDEADMMNLKRFQRPGSTIPVDIMNIVLSLRKQRNRGMVQTEEQYKFIHRAVLDEIVGSNLKLSDSVIQFMDDAMNDLNEVPQSARSGQMRRKSQPRSPRSTLHSLGSTVSLSSSGLSKLSKDSLNNSSSISLSDGEDDRKLLRLRESGESSGFMSPPVILKSPKAANSYFTPHQPLCKRNLAMSCANILPGNGSASSSLNQSSSSTGNPNVSSPPRNKHTCSLESQSNQGSSSSLEKSYPTIDDDNTTIGDNDTNDDNDTTNDDNNNTIDDNNTTNELKQEKY